MRIDFADDDLKELIITGKNKKYKKYAQNEKFMQGLATVYMTMASVSCTKELRAYSFLHYEQLRGTNGLSSVRVLNRMVERIIFREYEDGIRIEFLELNTNHYGNKK